MISLPQRVVIEENATAQLKDICATKKKERPLVICDQRMEELGSKIQELVSGEIIFPKSSEMEYLKTVSRNALDNSIVIGVGGGRIIDMAKYIAYLAEKGWISFPTILSHDGVVSSRAAITDNGAKISVDAKGPDAILVDTKIIKSAPYRYIAAGAADVVSNMASVEDWRLGAELGEKYSTVVAELSLLAAKTVMNHARDIRERTEHGIYTLSWSLICSGLAMNIYGSSRPASGSEHNFSHALEKLGSNLIHGEQCALGTIISMYLQNKDWKKIISVFDELGVPTSAKELDISKDILIKALVLTKTIRGYPRYTILERYDIDEKRAEEILRNTGII